MDKDKQLEYNLAVLKRRDASITKVLDMAGHVVLYQVCRAPRARAAPCAAPRSALTARRAFATV